jgi:hypothetical protein
MTPISGPDSCSSAILIDPERVELILMRLRDLSERIALLERFLDNPLVSLDRRARGDSGQRSRR